VLGIADEWAGERPKAYIVLKQGRREDKERVAPALIEYVQAKKDRHKWIVEIELMDEIPGSASGKMLRRMRRDRVRSCVHGRVARDSRERARI
jgi:4-coumarate--CoA ligase